MSAQRSTIVSRASIGLLAFCIAAALSARPAFAAESTTVDLSGIAGTLIAGVGGIALWLARTAVAALVGYVQQKTRLELDAHTREYLDQALERAIDYAATRADLLLGPTASAVDLHDATLARAVNYTIDHVPDALAHFGITATRLTDMVEARMSMMFDDATGPSEHTEGAAVG